MGAYRPPQPGVPPPGAPQTPYDRQMIKEQIRLNKQQARLQRDQIRMQARAMRRHSIVGPLVLVALGIVFLLAQMGRLSWGTALDWYAHWWPAVLILAGVILLAEWTIDQRETYDGQPRHARVLGAGVVVLLIFLALAGASSRLAHGTLDWADRTFGHGFPGFDVALGDRHDADDTANSAITAGTTLLIRNPHGDVTVTGSSDDGQIHVQVHKQAFARTDRDAANKESQLQPTFSNDGTNLVLNVASVEGGQADLTLQVPHNTPLTIRADHGDIDVKEVHAAVLISANHGDVDLTNIDGGVTAHINDEHSSFSAHSVTGGVAMDGRAGDLNISDVAGAVTLSGDFFGTTHLEQLRDAVVFKTSRTQFEAARIDGDFEVSLDSDLEAHRVLGPVTLTTRDRDVTLDAVQGSVKLVNRNGSVTVTDAAPVSDINIVNTHGSVDVGVPGGSNFVLAAETHNGDVENDFGLEKKGSEDRPSLSGTVGSGGPQISIVATDGDVTVRKATVTPLPPAPPAAPRISVGPAPVAPKTPSAPKVPAAAKAPAAPKAPPAPSAPPAPHTSDF